MNIYHEARGEPDAGKEAVGHVVLNRAADPRFPGQICDVVRQGGELPRYRCQFSWWCDGRSDAPRNVAAWQQARQVAALTGGVPNNRPLQPLGGRESARTMAAEFQR